MIQQSPASSGSKDEAMAIAKKPSNNGKRKKY
jgi:hypothetical protein